MENCPKCGYKNEVNSVECTSCGVILNKEKILEQIRAKEKALSIKQEGLRKTRTLREAKRQEVKAKVGARITLYSFRREVKLPIESVWSLLGNFTKTPGPGITVDVEKQGDMEANGVGTIRKITIGKVCLREILNSADPPSNFTYRILSGAPMKDYLGKVRLEPKESSTIIHWSAVFVPKIPLTGWICSWIASDSQHCLIDAVEKSIK
jgi:transcription initiation factor TFIIIB Brf1 subunit/transcription initiation factor TFIIB